MVMNAMLERELFEHTYQEARTVLSTLIEGLKEDFDAEMTKELRDALHFFCGCAETKLALLRKTEHWPDVTKEWMFTQRGTPFFTSLVVDADPSPEVHHSQKEEHSS